MIYFELRFIYIIIFKQFKIKMSFMIIIRKTIKFFSLLFIVGAVYFFTTAYSNYYQSVRALESYKYASNAAKSTVEHFLKHSKYPSSISSLNLDESDISYVGEINIDNKNG